MTNSRRKGHDFAHCTVVGKPLGKGRPRFTKRGHAYTPTDTANRENLIRLQFQADNPNWKPLTGAVTLVVDAFFGVPKSTSKKKRAAMLAGEISHTKKPDIDNILKAVCDALNGVAFDDDKQICGVQVSKGYSDSPRTEITVWDAEYGRREG